MTQRETESEDELAAVLEQHFHISQLATSEGWRPEETSGDSRVGEFIAKTRLILSVAISAIDTEFPGFRKVITAVLKDERPTNPTFYPDFLIQNWFNMRKDITVFMGVISAVFPPVEGFPEINIALVAGMLEDLGEDARGIFTLVIEGPRADSLENSIQITIKDLPIFPSHLSVVEEKIKRQLSSVLAEANSDILNNLVDAVYVRVGYETEVIRCQ